MKSETGKPTGSLGFVDGGDEGKKVAAAEELSEQKNGVTLCGGRVDPLKAGSENACLATSLSQYAATVAAHGFDGFSRCGLRTKKGMKTEGQNQPLISRYAETNRQT